MRHGWKTIAVHEVEPQTIGGIMWGTHEIIQQFGPVKRTIPRPSKGWRRHIRKKKSIALPVTMTYRRI
jgi:hypothetical protein